MGDIVPMDPRELMSPLDTFVLPISPVQILPKQRQGKYMGQLLLNHVVFVLAIQISQRDIVESSIGPVDVVSEVVNGQRIWPTKMVLQLIILFSTTDKHNLYSDVFTALHKYETAEKGQEEM